MNAQAQWRDGFRFEIITGTGHEFTVDASAEGGGTDAGARPTELLLAAIEPDRPRLAAAKRQSLQEKRVAYLAAHKIARDFDKPHFTCPACKDTSWLPEGRCSCYQAVLVPLLMSEANLHQ